MTARSSRGAFYRPAGVPNLSFSNVNILGEFEFHAIPLRWILAPSLKFYLAVNGTHSTHDTTIPVSVASLSREAATPPMLPSQRFWVPLRYT